MKRNCGPGGCLCDDACDRSRGVLGVYLLCGNGILWVGSAGTTTFFSISLFTTACVALYNSECL